MADFVPRVVIRDPTDEELLNTVANVVYNSIPWGRAAKNRWILLVKAGLLGVKGLTPEWQPFYSDDPNVQEEIDAVNRFFTLVLGADPEDIVKGLGTRGTIEGIKLYIFGGELGAIMVTHSFYGDP